MTNETQQPVAPKRKTSARLSIRSLLPWVIMAGAALVYLATVGRWVTLNGLNSLARLSGWDWQPVFLQPLWWLATYPIKWLPAASHPVMLNLLSAMLGVATLGLLARSVLLLPHDRTRDQRLREHSEFSLLSVRFAWVAPVLAVMALGLHRTFWEYAVTGMAEMLDVCLFAYVIRCLLEYRLSQKNHWLYQLAAVYGVAVPNDWAFIGFFPLTLLVLLSMKGRDFFRFGFLFKMLGLGLLGLTLYLFLPAVNPPADSMGLNFWQSVGANLGYQKMQLLNGNYRLPLFIMSLTSLFPLLFIAVKWPSFTGDINPIGTYAQTLAFRVLHLLLFVAAVFVMCKAPYQAYLNTFPIKYMTMHYLCALAIGYFAGYLMLVFGERVKAYFEHASWVQKAGSRLLVWLVYACVLAVPAWLIKQNLPVIQAINAPTLRNFTRLMASALPEKPAVLLSDDPVHLFLAEAWFAAQPGGNPHVMLSTRALSFHGFHRYLQKRYPNRWEPLPKRRDGGTLPEPIPPMALLDRIIQLGLKEDLYYLHPSFGYYFEAYYTESRGVVQRLRMYPPETLDVPRIGEGEINYNREFWNQAASFMTRFPQLTKQGNMEARIIATFYSRALNFWGVKLQRQGWLPEAAQAFSSAAAINTDNVIAEINLALNKKLIAKKIEQPQLDKQTHIKLGTYRSWDAIMSVNGPFDDLDYAFALGHTMARNGLLRQSLQQFQRIKDVVPNSIPVDLALAETFIKAGNPQRSLQILEVLKTSARPELEESALRVEIARMEALSLMAMGKAVEAEGVISQLAQRLANDLGAVEALARVFIDIGRHQKALELYEQVLQYAPDNAVILANKAAALMNLGQHNQALEPLNLALRLSPDNLIALQNRAICHLQMGNHDKAEFDYERVRRMIPNYFPALYGLAEISYRRKDTVRALKFYSEYLKFAPAGLPEREVAGARMRELKGK